MNLIIKNPVSINEGFQCEHCQKKNPKALKTCRNHCRYCLYSKHVDELIPGDRQSICHGLMEPEKILYQNKKGYQIVHSCLSCRQEKINKAAEDDDPEMLIRIMQKQNTTPLETEENKMHNKSKSWHRNRN